LLHTLPSGLHGTREPLQFGAELFGHAGLEADLEVIDLALDCARSAGLQAPTLDISDARIVRGLLAGVPVDSEHIHSLIEALAAKDGTLVAELSNGLADEVRSGLLSLLRLYGGDDVLTAAEHMLPKRALISAALRDLRLLAQHLSEAHADVSVGFDLADLGGYAYYSGARFAVYAHGGGDALLRGGRYDEVGAVFGRSRPAVGFSVFDLKELAERLPVTAATRAIRAPWSQDPALRGQVRSLRAEGETVVCIPVHQRPMSSPDFDRELVCVDGHWTVRPL
jgi:ATP phosphoribosyltransferase regulatory subunit